MTKDEIKASVTMPDILARYGVDVRHRRCKGFCHYGRDYNMAVYDTSCYCFVCDKSFDVFGVVQFFENCDFPKAFEILGGDKTASFTAMRKARERQEIQRQEDIKNAEFSKKMELFCKMDYVIMLYNSTANPNIQLTELYIYAVKNIERIKWEIETR